VREAVEAVRMHLDWMTTLSEEEREAEERRVGVRA
jgi:hypothetical protein